MSEQPPLDLSTIIDFKSLQNSDFFNGSTNLLDFLGKNLIFRLNTFLGKLGVTSTPVIHGEVEDFVTIKGPVYISKGAKVESGAYIVGPCFIGSGSEVRHGAYIRGNVFVGNNCIVGHTTEVKGSIFCDHSKAGHFAYVGDSILGQYVNLGAGTKLANLKFNQLPVAIIDPTTRKKAHTGLKKLGGILGDHSQTGCNSVLSPGSILLPKTAIHPCAHHIGTKFE